MRPELERSLAGEDDEDLLLGAVAVWRVVELACRNLEQLQPRLVRTRGSAEVAHGARDARALAFIGLDVLDVHDPAGPFDELPDLRRPGRSLAFPRVVVGRALEHPRRPEPRDTRPWEQRICRIVPLAEREDVETVRAGLERVRVHQREMDETVAGTDGESLLPRPVALHRDPAPVEDEEELFVRAFEVERRRPLPRVDPDPLDADPVRRLARQRLPVTRDVPRLAADGADVVPV